MEMVRYLFGHGLTLHYFSIKISNHWERSPHCVRTHGNLDYATYAFSLSDMQYASPLNSVPLVSIIFIPHKVRSVNPFRLAVIEHSNRRAGFKPAPAFVADVPASLRRRACLGLLGGVDDALFDVLGDLLVVVELEAVGTASTGH